MNFHGIQLGLQEIAIPSWRKFNVASQSLLICLVSGLKIMKLQFLAAKISAKCFWTFCPHTILVANFSVPIVQIVCICTDFVLGGLYNNNSGRITSIVAAPGFDCFSLCWFYYLQIKREISTMKLVKHPNIVQIFEVSQCPFQWKLLSWKRGYESSWVD